MNILKSVRYYFFPKPKTVKEALEQGKVKITFQKNNGEIRTKIVTRKSALIPIEKREKGGVNYNPDKLVFFSLNENTWNCTANVLNWELAR